MFVSLSFYGALVDGVHHACIFLQNHHLTLYYSIKNLYIRIIPFNPFFFFSSLFFTPSPPSLAHFLLSSYVYTLTLSCSKPGGGGGGKFKLPVGNLARIFIIGGLDGRWNNEGGCKSTTSAAYWLIRPFGERFMGVEGQMLMCPVFVFFL